MTDELKPCPFCGAHAFALPPTLGEEMSGTDPKTHPGRFYSVIRCSNCGAAMDGPNYDRTCSKAAALWNTRHIPDVQAAIDAALESVAKYLDTHQMTIHQSAYDWAVDIIRSRIGTNPLAEAQTKIKELNGLCLYHEGFERELEGELRAAEGRSEFNLHAFTEQARRIAELERELSEQADTIVDGLAKRRELERELAEARKDRRRLAAMMPLFQEARDAICYIPLTTAKLRGLDLTLADRMDTVGIKEKWEEYDAAMRQEDE